MTRVGKGLDLIDGILNRIAAAMMFLIMVIVTVDVVFRYLFNAPLGWSYDVVQLYLMVGLFFFTLSHALNAHAHVSVDLLLNYMPARMRHLTESVGYLCASVVFAGIVYVSFWVTVNNYVGHAVAAGAINWPMWLAHIAVPIGCFVMLLRMVYRFVGHGVSVLTNRSVIPLPPVSGAGEEH